MTIKKTVRGFANVCYVDHEEASYYPKLAYLRTPLNIMTKRKPMWTFVLSHSAVAPDGCDAHDMLALPISDTYSGQGEPIIHVLDEYNEYLGSLWLTLRVTNYNECFVYAYSSPRTHRNTRTADHHRTTACPKKAARDAIQAFRPASVRELADDCITRCYSVDRKNYSERLEMSDGNYNTVEESNSSARHNFWDEEDQDIARLGEKALGLIEAHRRYSRSQSQSSKYQHRTRLFCTKVSGSFVLARFGKVVAFNRSTARPRWAADEAVRIPREAMPREWAVRFARLAVSPAAERDPKWEVDVGVRTSESDFILHVPEEENGLWEALVTEYGENNG